ncbi:exodeoxyribonuclease VII small subunit [Candidatus Uhrbacteria bacterium RIFCSPLOWO2_01_FULL_53_9]|uniref:Exodeoxyribonuclease 7 small subunit n=3 Tax=Candidatus Uhriibacteriota TaxID=1752732 RepID=A0A1F7UYV2_9BACT|nr:MAG: exodeoxyribonuclease VII small subunit [Candidatus Uhrbacteria bacterium RIFCSPHIGHO2_02_FULL_53_13]OGL83430.1 MAG: exodeoxyribonuclease VII small subunit [Candidatus Uhrbacteria bacterium RIFCSPLOWO2_01_FULL_53_9]OGL89110.1 MAG: exodeoxyribonuclease VII small subunit [Candidatus Uhrbacteria bacterium RIFCSPLOWO2_02_FULL_53_10]
MSSKTLTTFKAAYAELEKIAEGFESNAFDLEKGLKDFERGLELAEFCKKHLNDMEVRVKEIQGKYQV